MSISRRHFIRNGLGFVSLGLTMPSVLFKASKALAQEPAKGNKILVVLEMAGGNDGLNTIIPLGEEFKLYQQNRPTIGLAKTDIVDIGGGLGMHPALKPLADIYRQGKMALVTGVGYPHQSHSHFVSMDIWQTSSPQRQKRDGWIGRYLDAEGHFNGKPLGGLMLGNELPLAFHGKNTTSSVVGGDAGNGLGTKAHDKAAQMAAFRQMYDNGTTASGASEFVHNVGKDIYLTADSIKDAMRHYDAKAGLKANYPARNGLANRLRTISELICGGLPTRVYYTITGGFDTHSNQVRGQQRALGQMGEAVAAFYRDLTLQGRADDVTLMTFSEFGRRVPENASHGTDHGSASVMFVVGGAVRGGHFGQYPSLQKDAMDHGNLRYNTDFRSIYATLLDNWLGTPSQAVLGGKFDTLKFV